MLRQSLKNLINSIGEINTALIITSFFTLLAVSFFIFFYQTQSYLFFMAEKYAHEISEKNKGVVDNSIDDIMRRLDFFALMIDENKLKNNLTPILTEMEENGLKEEFQAVRVLVMNENGDAITGDGLRSNFSHREYFTKAMGGDPNVSQRIFDIWSNEPIHVFATPIIANQNIVGVAAITLAEDVLGEILQKSLSKGESFFYVTQNNGDIISQPNHQGNKWIGSNVIDVLSKAGAKNEDVNITSPEKNLDSFINRLHKVSLEDSSIYLSAIKSKYNDWYIVSIVPDSFVATWYKYFPRVFFAVLIVVALLFGLISIILKSRKEFNKKMNGVLFFDPVTGIGTLKLIKEKYESFVQNNCSQGVAVIAFDIIGFKVLNLSIGRKSCDLILRFIADSTSQVFDENTLVARASADNFVIITYYKDVDNILEKLNSLSNKIYSNELMRGAKTVFGVYLLKNNDCSMEESIDRAELAKISSKTQQKNGGVAFFNEGMLEGKLRRKNIEASMYDALINGEFKLYLQPKISLSDGRIVGAEALTRWIPKSGTPISPAEFIPIFEDNGFIYDLDCWVLTESCQALQKIMHQKLNFITPISINISRAYMHRADLIETIENILKKHEIPCNLIELEITETSTQQFSNISFFVDLIEKIHSKGFSVSIDDFGSGYSSLRIFSKLPVDYVKFDKEFFKEVHERDAHVIRGFLDVAHALNISTIAEGIETQEQIQRVKSMGFDIVQGYYYSKPLPINEYLIFIKDFSAN